MKLIQTSSHDETPYYQQVGNPMNNSIKKYVQVVRTASSGKQIVMFPFGGGSGYSYMPIIHLFPRDLEVVIINPPGHMINGGKPLEHISEMAACYAKELRDLVHEQTLFFGHSIGGGVAYATICALHDTVEIKHLVISSVLPPHCINDTVDMYANMDDEELIEKCTALGGLPEIFKAEPVLLEGFLYGLRGDLKALENLAAEPKTKPLQLSVNATILYSDKDPIVDLTKLKQWESYLSCSEYVRFTGHHFYLLESHHMPTVAQLLAEKAKLAADLDFPTPLE